MNVEDQGPCLSEGGWIVRRSVYGLRERDGGGTVEVNDHYRKNSF